ncbi:MAG: O-antigen ligase family protein [Anaerolineae bacterium]
MRERMARWTERLSIWALSGLLITLPFWRHRVLLHRAGGAIFFEFRDITLYTNDLLWWAAVGVCFLSCLLRPTPRALRLGPWFISGSLAAILALSVLGIPFAFDQLYASYQTVRLLLLAFLYLMILNVSLTPGIVAWSLAASMTLEAVFALPQSVLGSSLGLERLGEVTVKAAWPGASVVMVGEQRWLRAYGLTQHPNLLGGCMMVMLLLVAGFYLKQSGWRRFPLLIALGLGFSTLLLTFSRAAWLGTGLGGAVMLALLLWTRRRRHWSPSRSTVLLLITLFLVIGAIFAIVNWPLLQPRLGLTSQGAEIRSVESRAMQLRAAWILIKERPWLGVGIGNYPVALYELAREAVSAYPVFQPVHNVALLSTAELGFLGGMIWLGLMAAPWAALWRKRWQVQVTSWWAGLSGALAALAVVSFFDYYVWSSHQGRLLLWLVFGLWAREWILGVGRDVNR